MLLYLGGAMMHWKQVAVGKTAATWVNEHGAMISFIKVGEETSFRYVSEGKGYSVGKILMVLPTEIPLIKDLQTSKVRKERFKFLRVSFMLKGINFVVETEVLKK